MTRAATAAKGQLSLTRRKWLRRLLIANAVLLAGLVGHRILNPPPLLVGGGEPDSPEAQAIKAKVYASIPPDDAAGFARIDPANPGGWLTVGKEPLQSLEVYRALPPLRPTAACRTIVLQPLEQMDSERAKMLEALRDYATAFFQLPVRLEKPSGFVVPASWIRGTVVTAGGRGRQYDAVKLAYDFLGPRRPADAVAYVGITQTDLWAGEANFVFGIGSSEQNTAVYSLARYFPEFWGRPRRKGDEVRALRRACKVLNHEVGHIFGLSHCVFYRCSMNGANSLQETDAAPTDYCPVCHRKLLWNIGWDGAKRYAALLAFYRKHGMTEDVRWVSARLTRWQRIAAREATDSISAR